MDKELEDKATGPKPRHVPSERPGPVGGKRDQNRRRRTRELCEAGLALFLEHGTESVTIDQIVEQAGIAKGSFYRYFKDKEELVETLFAPLQEALEDNFNTCAQAVKEASELPGLLFAYQEFAIRLNDIFFENRQLILLYLQENRAPAHGARKAIGALAVSITKGANALTNAAEVHGLLRPFDPRVSTLAVIGALERILFGFLRDEDVGEFELFAPSFISLIFDGLRFGDQDAHST